MGSFFINFTVSYVFHKLVSSLPKTTLDSESFRHHLIACLPLPEQETSLLK